ncbi:MAG: PEP-CTERM sorting domain-containing protein [Myxococcota bacterium]
MKLKLVITLASMLLFSAAASATPIVVSDPAAVGTLSPGSTSTITFSIEPDSLGVKGFTMFFEISDVSSIELQSCSSPVDAAPVCPVGGSQFNFAVLDFNPAETDPFVIGSATVNIPLGATLDATIASTLQSSITLGNFDEVFPPAQVYAQVIPEPGTFALLSLGLGGVARRRLA